MAAFLFFNQPSDDERTFQTNMAKLKPFIPESEMTDDLKGAYTLKNGRYELNQLDASHPAVVALEEIKSKDADKQTQISTLTAEKANLERERDELKGKSLPEGFRAVPADIAELGSAAKAANLSKDELPTLKDTVAKFETEKAASARREELTKAFKFAEVSNLEEAFNRKATDDLKIEWKTVDGVSKPFVIGEKDGQKTETLFDKKYLSEASGFASGAAALFASSKTGFEFPGETKGNPPANEWEQYAAEGKALAAQKSAEPTSNIFAQAK